MTKLQKSYDTKLVGEKIKQLRKSRNLKQDDLMEVLNLSRPAISNIETGRRNINLHQIKALSDYFGVSIETLGFNTEKVEINDLIERARIIFNSDAPIVAKQELAEIVYKMYLEAKEQTKK